MKLGNFLSKIDNEKLCMISAKDPMLQTKSSPSPSFASIRLVDGLHEGQNHESVRESNQNGYFHSLEYIKSI